METLKIIAQTPHNETIFKEFRFSDVVENYDLVSSYYVRRYIVQAVATHVNNDATASLLSIVFDRHFRKALQLTQQY